MANPVSPSAQRAMISYRQQERDLLAKQLPGATPHGEGHVGKQRAEEITDRIKALNAEIAALQATPAPAS